MGFFGKTLLSINMDDLAVSCFERSNELRPGVFLHHNFVGDAFFENGKFEYACRAYEQALRYRPYLRYINAKKIYSQIACHQDIESEFCSQKNLELLFQRRHDFYSAISPLSK